MSQIDNERLLSIIERIEHVDEEISSLKEDRKEIMAEAKGSGFDTKAIAHVVRLRKMDKAKRDEEQTIFAVYESAVGLS